MTETRLETLVAVAFAHPAKVDACRLYMSREEGEHIERTLCNLLDLGHIVAFTVQHIGGGTTAEPIEQLRLRVGREVLDACQDAPKAPTRPSPAFLMPIWGFDHEFEGSPAATGRLLGLDLELIATPSSDEELGAYLPGRDGRWLIHASPMF